MVKKMIESFNYNQIDNRKLTELFFKAKGKDVTEEGIKSFIEQLDWFFNAYDNKIFLIKKNEEYAGCLIATIKEDRVTFNQWFLDGLPFVNEQLVSKDIAHQLIKEATKWCQSQNKKRILMALPNTLSEFDQSVINQGNFKLHYNYVYMICDMEYYAVQPINVPDEISIQHISQVPHSDLVNCFVRSFEKGDAKFFHELCPDEKPQFFSFLGYEHGVKSKASYALMKNEKVIGFSIVHEVQEHQKMISCMNIVPEETGKGYGKLLMSLIMNKAKEEGCPIVHLGTETSMIAYHMYNKFDFRVTNGINHYCLDL